MTVHVLIGADQRQRELGTPACDYSYRIAPQPIGGGLKRAFDVLIASVALVFLTPVLLAVAALIVLDSRGPVLFRQPRSGFRGKQFSVLKFRTMRADACKGPVAQAQRVDGRVTRVGRFLRRTSIDELPQLLNVLRGEMSLVGPRPHAISHDYDFCSADKRYTRRFHARPGVTGLAQVSGCRGPTETPAKIRERLRHDLHYVNNWSIWLDLAILWKTACVVLSDRNAF